MIYLTDIPKVMVWKPLFEKYAAKYTFPQTPTPILDWKEIFCICWGESTGNPWAVNPNDPSWGLMSVNGLIARAYGGVPTPTRSANPISRVLKSQGYGYDRTAWIFDPSVNVSAGSGFLADLKRKYSVRFPNYHWVAPYNCGETEFLKGNEDLGYVGNFIGHMNALNSYLNP